MHSCLAACYDSSLSTSSSWFGRLDSSGWLTHVTKLLEYARKIVLAVHSDGKYMHLRNSSEVKVYTETS